MIEGFRTETIHSTPARFQIGDGLNNRVDPFIWGAAAAIAPVQLAARLYYRQINNGIRTNAGRRRAWLKATAATAAALASCSPAPRSEQMASVNAELITRAAGLLNIQPDLSQDELRVRALASLTNDQLRAVQQVGTLVDARGNTRTIQFDQTGEIIYDVDRLATYFRPSPLSQETYGVPGKQKSITYVGTLAGDARMRAHEEALTRFVDAYFPDADYPQNLYLVYAQRANYGKIGEIPPEAYMNGSGVTGIESPTGSDDINKISVVISVEETHTRALSMGLAPEIALAATLANERFDILAINQFGRYVERAEWSSSLAGLLTLTSPEYRTLLIGGSEAESILPVLGEEMQSSLDR